MLLGDSCVYSLRWCNSEMPVFMVRVADATAESIFHLLFFIKTPYRAMKYSFVQILKTGP